MNQEGRPLPVELEALLACERDAPGPPTDARERVRARLYHTLGLAIGAGVAAHASTASGQAAAVKTSALGWHALQGKLLAGLLAVGGAAALQVTVAQLVAMKEQTESARSSRALATTQAPPARVEPAWAPAVPAPPATPAGSRAPSPWSRPSPPRASTLGRERIMLEEARRRLMQHDAAGALSALERHERRFPGGQLAEERDSLQVRALVGTGRLDLARARAEQFRRRYPQSLFLPAVDAAPTTP